MEVYELFAERMVLETMLEVLYDHKSDIGNLNRRHRHKDNEVWESTKVDWLMLPTEIWLNIFKYLSQAELYFIVHAVCKMFHCLSRDIYLWISIDFHKMHLDMKQLSERGLISIPAEITTVHFNNLLTVFQHHVRSVAMSRFITDCGLNGKSLNVLCLCTSLTKLDIGFCYETDMLSIIACNCSMIEDLNTEGCSDLKDEDFADIHLLKNLRKICVSHCAFLTDQFLVYLYDLSHLREFLCDGVMHFTEYGLIDFVKHQPDIQVLILDGEDMSDDLVCYVANNLPNLVVFEMSFSQCLTDQSVSSFNGKYQIEKLKFRKCSDVTSVSICNLFDSGTLSRLRSFSITECEGITDDALSSLSQCCVNLESLTVDWCWRISDAGLYMIINRCKILMHLSLVGLYGITGNGWLDHLDERLPRLRLLDASDCNTIPDDELVNLVRRKRSLEVYTYFHDRVAVPCDDDPRLPTDEINAAPWVCPGARGVEVIF